MNSIFSSVTAQQLRKAAGIKEKIDALHAELNRILRTANEVGHRLLPQKRRKMSRAAIARISAAAKARWARIRGTAGKSNGKPRRKMSAAGKARLSALARARWKKAKAQGRSAL